MCVCVSRGVVNVIENHCPYVDKERQRGLVGAWAGFFLWPVVFAVLFSMEKMQAEKAAAQTGACVYVTL